MKQLLWLIGICLTLPLNAQHFEEFFEHRTLRVDYIFSGDSKKQQISVDGLSTYPIWAGKTKKLAINPLKGNGSIRVNDETTGELLYTYSFSSLFQEWLDTDEANHIQRAFENTFLVPFPKKDVIITINLFDISHKRIAKLSHKVSPNDILIEKKGFEDITPYRILQRGNVKNPIDVAILAEGYTAHEMNRFYQDAEKAMESIFNHEPFKSNKEKFNFIAVGSISKDTGVSIPHKDRWRATAFGAHFDTFYSERYLTTRNVKSIHDALAGIPYEHIILLANTDQYGGGGIYNSYTLTSAHHEMFEPVVVHEFGHSFGGLADEYFYEQDTMTDIYPLDIEPWEPNITTLVNFESKWKSMLKESTPIPTSSSDTKSYPLGVYEGGGYSTKGIYRPAFDCRMRTNTFANFCPACQAALTKLINFYTD